MSGSGGRGLMVKSEGDGVEHVLEVRFLPAAVLREIDPQGGQASGDSLGRLAFVRPAVADEALADGLGRVCRDRQPFQGSHAANPTGQTVQPIQGVHAVRVGGFKDDDRGSELTDPVADGLHGGGEALLRWQQPEREDSRLDQGSSSENGVPEVPEAGIKGEDRLRCGFGHGV